MANTALLRANKANDFQTPIIALKPLLSFLPRRIWECACGKGNLVDALLFRGFEVLASDIQGGHDFLDWTPPLNSFDCIVTNPPYSLKDKFLQRCYLLDYIRREKTAMARKIRRGNNPIRSAHQF